MKKGEEKPKNHTIIHVVVMLAMLFFGSIAIRNTIVIIKDYNININANYVEVNATIFEYKRCSYYNQIYYETYYQYIDQNNFVYAGVWETDLKTEEEAKERIGQKVTIYVDHEMKKKVRSLNFTYKGAWSTGIEAGVCLLIFLNSFIREIIYLVRMRRYKKIQEGNKIILDYKGERI